MGAMYTTALFRGHSNATSVVPVLSIELTVLYRERAAGMYSPLAYAFSQVGSLSATSSRKSKQKCYLKLIRASGDSGRHRDPLRLCADRLVHSTRLLNDERRLDGCQVLLLSPLHVFHVSLLHVLGNDACLDHAKCPLCTHDYDGMRLHLEPFLWSRNPPTCKRFGGGGFIGRIPFHGRSTDCSPPSWVTYKPK